MLHYRAALLPELYHGVVMLDSPLPTWFDQTVIWAAKRLGFIDRLTPAGRTLGRREQFSSAEEARAYFAGKALFSSFDPECLEAYIEHGLEPAGQGCACASIRRPKSASTAACRTSRPAGRPR